MKVEKTHELEYIKSILTPEEFLEYQKELKRMKIRFVVDEEEIKQLEITTKQKTMEFLSKYADKHFCISQEFYDYAMDTLYESIRWSKEFPIVGIFKPEDGQMVMKRFIDSN